MMYAMTDADEAYPARTNENVARELVLRAKGRFNGWALAFAAGAHRFP